MDRGKNICSQFITLKLFGDASVSMNAICFLTLVLVDVHLSLALYSGVMIPPSELISELLDELVWGKVEGKVMGSTGGVKGEC